ncbi:MAG: TatD family hydrolase [Elusimicrobiota bacterium]
MTLIDTHAHLSDEAFAPDREAVLERALAAGVELIVEIADSPADWEKALSLCRARPSRVRCALGLHPYYADQWSGELHAKLVRAAAVPEVAAVGEIGLDYAKCPLPPPQQKTALLGMLDAAEEAGKPVVLHCRDAYPDLLELLESRFRGRPPAKERFRGVVHCFSGDREQALRCVGLGFDLGVAGPVTYPKNHGLREALAAAGLGSLVLETDSPYLPPQSSRGKRNEPSAVAEIAAGLAAALKLPVEEVARATSANARELFRLA